MQSGGVSPHLSFVVGFWVGIRGRTGTVSVTIADDCISIDFRPEEAKLAEALAFACRALEASTWLLWATGRVSCQLRSKEFIEWLLALPWDEIVKIAQANPIDFVRGVVESAGVRKGTRVELRCEDRVVELVCRLLMEMGFERCGRAVEVRDGC